MELVNDELKKYIPVVNLIAEMFGNNCEVVLHDLSKLDQSVVYIVNSHVTGREVGESFDYLINRVLISNNFENDLLANYYFTSRNGNKIKSSTAFLRDNKHKVIGALCVNFATDELERFSNQISDFLKENVNTKEDAEASTSDIDSSSTDSPSNNNIEGFSNIDDILDDILDSSIPISALNMSREDKIETIRLLDDKGVFLIKGAIDKTAINLGVSKVTVYSYLDEIRTEN